MLLDTSGLLSFLDAQDGRHAEAMRHFQAAGRRVTHSYVLAELVALIHARRLNRAAGLAFISDLTDNPHVEMHWVDEARHRQAFALLQAQNDKSYSLCDAVSFLLMRERGLTDALTTDHHFEQAGFVRLLKP
jgi:uncharacterized protein